MKKNLFKRGMAGLLSLVMCLTALVGIGTTTAYAAGERAEVYLVSFPRSGDANIDYSGTWGHPNLRYMNGWHSGASKYTTIRAMHSYDGNICYCIPSYFSSYFIPPITSTAAACRFPCIF